MALRSADPTPEEISELCRGFRFGWNEEEREEALAYAPSAATTDAADDYYLEALESGRTLTFEQCLEEINGHKVAPLESE